MSRVRLSFCYRYGLLGGVSTQLLNRYASLSRHFDLTIIYEKDHGMASRFPDSAAFVAPTPAAREDLLRKLSPDITVVIDSPNFIDAWRVAGSPGRLVLEVHTTTASLSYLHRRDRLADVAHIVTVSSYMADILRRLEMDKIAPITVVPNCLADNWLEEPVSNPLAGHPIVWVGKLDGHKRWRTAVEIMDALSEETGLEIRPIMIGGFTAPEREVMAITKRMSTSGGLARGVWWPRVEYDRMPKLYSSVGANGGIQLCTSTDESFGMAVAESIIRGCPVVAPAVGALPELLPQAALYRARDWTDARAKIRRALVDADFRTELLSTSHDVLKLTRPERVTDAYRHVVEQVLGAVR